VLGPLPPLHRWVVTTLALVACIGVGAWLGSTLPVAMLAQTGATIGALAGAVVVLLLLHEPSSPPRSVRHRRH